MTIICESCVKAGRKLEGKTTKITIWINRHPLCAICGREIGAWWPDDAALSESSILEDLKGHFEIEPYPDKPLREFLKHTHGLGSRRRKGQPRSLPVG